MQPSLVHQFAGDLRALLRVRTAAQPCKPARGVRINDQRTSRNGDAQRRLRGRIGCETELRSLLCSQNRVLVAEEREQSGPVRHQENVRLRCIDFEDACGFLPQDGCRQ
jgi:hypothetical protein